MKKLLIIPVVLLSVFARGQSSDDVNKLLYNSASFVVPSSPAFELLPDKASEVTHLVTSHDLTANVLPLFMNGTKVQQGLAFDGRPFVYLVNKKKFSLADYQNHYAKRLLTRVVLSAGTAPVPDTDDTFLSGGLRIPLIDKGDPRNDSKYIEGVESDYRSALLELGPLPLNPSDEVKAARSKYASSKVEGLRTEFANANWNKTRLEIGGALMYRAEKSKFDALTKNRSGLWLSGSAPLGKQMQLIVSGKSSWIKTDSAKQESSRSLMGCKARYFGKNYKIGFAAEFAYVWSVFEGAKNLNQEWTHYAFLVEFPIPKMASYLGLVVGFDGERKDEASSPKVEFRYAFYTDRLLKKD